LAITYSIQFNVRPEQRERFVRLLEGVLDAMRSEPMFHEAVLHRDPNDENHFMLYESWEDHDDVLTTQLGRPYREEWHGALDEILATPRDITIWQKMRTDRRVEAGILAP
jgi:quinol monooxygenase YgiN